MERESPVGKGRERMEMEEESVELVHDQRSEVDSQALARNMLREKTNKKIDRCSFALASLLFLLVHSFACVSACLVQRSL